MKNNRLRIPVFILVAGLLLSLAVCLVVNVVRVPAVTKQEFAYSVTYELCGEMKTLEGIYKVTFDGYAPGEDPGDRYYSGEYTVDGQTTRSHSYTIARHEGGELYIVTLFNDGYLMGDTGSEDYEPALEAPYLEAVDTEGYTYEEADMPAAFDAQIISWEYPEPVENSFVFRGFSILHTGSMLAMLAVGLLVIVTCLVLVKRDKTVSYGMIDRISFLANCAVVLVVIPFITFATGMLQLTVETDSLLYQIFLCIPAVTAFSVAASICLRRRGFPLAGLLIQFVGPVVFFLPVVLEPILG